MRTKRRFLTLIELILVITVIIIVTGVIGINIRRAMISQRFRSEVELLVDTMRLAQDLMLVLGKDTHIKIGAAPGGEGITYRLEIEGGAPKEWDSIMSRSLRTLTSTHYVTFDKQDNFPSSPGEIDLRFQSQGSMMSKGELRLSTHENPFIPEAQRRSICLKGYPHALKSMDVYNIPSSGNEWVPCKIEEEQEYFSRLTLYTQEEVLADQPPKTEESNEPTPAPSPQSSPAP